MTKQAGKFKYRRVAVRRAKVPCIFIDAWGGFTQIKQCKQERSKYYRRILSQHKECGSCTEYADDLEEYESRIRLRRWGFKL